MKKMKKKTKLTSFSNDFVNKMCAVIDKQQKKNKKKRGRVRKGIRKCRKLQRKCGIAKQRNKLLLSC